MTTILVALGAVVVFVVFCVVTAWIVDEDED